MRQYRIRLTFKDRARLVSTGPIVALEQASTVDAARLGRAAERVNLWSDDQEASAAASRWLRLHRRAAGAGPKFDRWTASTVDRDLGVYVIVAAGDADDE